VERKINKIIEQIVSFVKYDYPSDIEEDPCDESNRSGSSEYWYVFSYRMAYEAIFGYRDGYCEEGCMHRQTRLILGEKKFIEPKRLNCYECGREYFVNMLCQIVTSVEYSNIKGLDTIIRNCYANIGKTVIITDAPAKSPFKEEFKESIDWQLGLLFIDVSIENFKRKFLDFFEHIIAFSLSEFLLHNDRRKLKNCPYCHNFFIANDIRKQRCKSDDCRKVYEREKKKNKGKRTQ
jgi:hypothetical protein